MARTNTASSTDLLPDLSPEDTTRLTLLLALLRWLTSAPIRAYLEAHDAAATRATRAASTPDLALARDALLRSLNDAETPNQRRLAATALARLPSPKTPPQRHLRPQTPQRPATPAADPASPAQPAPNLSPTSAFTDTRTTWRLPAPHSGHDLPIADALSLLPTRPNSPTAALLSRAGAAHPCDAPNPTPPRTHPPPIRKSA